MLTQNEHSVLREAGILGESVSLRKEKLSGETASLMKSFFCGNDVIDAFFREKAADSIREVTFLYLDEARGQVAAAVSLSCSAIPVMDADRFYDAIPSVEITYFAVDERYQKLPQTSDKEDGYFSDYILGDIISCIYTFTENTCGASHVLLYATENAVHFYKRNFFTEIDEDFMLVKSKKFLDGCVPMLLAL